MKDKFEEIKNGPDKCKDRENGSNTRMHREKSVHVTDKSGHVTERSGHVTERSGHVTDKSGHVTERSGHVIDKSGHVTDKSGHVTDKSSHVTYKSSHVTDRSGHVIDKSEDVKENCKESLKAILQLQTARPSPSDVVVFPQWMPRDPQDDSSGKRKLIIHLDIRNTILVADSVTNVSVEEALNSFLTGVVWGRVVNGEWMWHSTRPSLKSPAPGLCTYYKYLEKTLVKNSTDRINLRLQTGDFAHTALGQSFRKDFDTHLQQLTWDYGMEAYHDKVLTMSGRDGTPYHYILPSVYKLLQHLTEHKRDFAIVIRTYGRDAPNVLSSLNYGLRGNHPAFKEPFNINVCEHPGRINREHDQFELIACNQTEDSEDGLKLTFEEDIYRHLCASQGITGFVDDFLHWQKENYDHAAGKPMWIDPSDHKHHHIFFDDNFRADDEDSIIDVRMFNSDAPRTSRSLEHSELVQLEDVFLVQADLLEIINDEEYFIRKTELCERNLAKMTTTDTT